LVVLLAKGSARLRKEPTKTFGQSKPHSRQYQSRPEIEEVQHRLWEQSQAHKQNREAGTPLFPTNPYDGRIGNLMDLMHNPAWIAAACDRVLKRSRGTAAGVDGVRVCDFKESLESRLEQLRLELKRGTYKPLPLRRVEIPKANGKMRQLGIPTV
jgi:hypothetical protein